MPFARSVRFPAKRDITRQVLTLPGWSIMRLLSSILVLFVFTVCGSAQTSSAKSAEPDVTVIQKKWRIDVRNPALEKDPVQAMQDREREDRRRRDNERLNDMMVERGMPSQTTQVSGNRDTGPSGITVLYVYEVKLRNEGAKEIRKIMWDYVFFEPGTETEVGRRRFISKADIRPRGTKDVVARAAAPPAATINAKTAGKKPQDQYSERVVIQRVEYADGSVWRASSN